jgi:hypothetical protein
MPYVFVTSLFPPHTTDQLAKIYVDTLKDVRSKLRATGKEIIANAIKATTQGIEVIGVWDIKEGKLEEFLTIEGEVMTNYHKIKGFRYSMDVRFKSAEALALIGMKMPE